MHIIRKLFLFILVALLSWLGVYTYNQLTDGFSVQQMSSSLPPYPQYEVSLPEERKEALQQILNQPFHYIGKGCQFYAFESEDGKYVLKFLKHKHLRPFTWLNTIPMPQKLRAMSDAKIERRQKRVEALFSSCKLAFEELAEEAGLLYIHLNRTPALNKTVTIHDKLGFKHTISVDAHEFVVQKKALLVKEAFERHPERAEEWIEQLIALVYARYEKGIADRDRSFVQNVAFSFDGERGVFIDIGQFYKDPALLTEEERTKDLKKRLGNLRYWASCHFPEHLPLIDQKISKHESHAP